MIVMMLVICRDKMTANLKREFISGHFTINSMYLVHVARQQFRITTAILLTWSFNPSPVSWWNCPRTSSHVALLLAGEFWKTSELQRRPNLRIRRICPLRNFFGEAWMKRFRTAKEADRTSWSSTQKCVFEWIGRPLGGSVPCPTTRTTSKWATCTPTNRTFSGIDRAAGERPNAHAGRFVRIRRGVQGRGSGTVRPGAKRSRGCGSSSGDTSAALRAAIWPVVDRPNGHPA